MGFRRAALPEDQRRKTPNIALPEDRLRRTRRVAALPHGWRRRGLTLGLLLGLAVAASARAATHEYRIDQDHGSIGFSVSQLGLFNADGRFTRFAGDLAIDQDHPDATRIDVTIAANSVAMGFAGAVSMLRSPDYFDVAQFPAIHFVSRSITQMTQNHFVINGVLTIRGITHPQMLDAMLVRERLVPGGPRVADFRVTGTVRRTDFGMTANRIFVGNMVHLRIAIRLMLDPSSPHG